MTKSESTQGRRWARAIVAILPLMFAVACGAAVTSPTSSDTKGGGTGSSANAPLSATIDGTTFAATASTQAQFNSGILSITGTDGRQTLSLMVTVSRGIGTYSTGVVDPNNVVVSTLSSVGSTAGWVSGPTSGSGSVKITSLTSTGAAGTFSLTLAPAAGTGASGNKAIANGVFNVTFTAPVTLPPGTVSGTLTALVDGAPFAGAVSARATNTGGLITVSGQDTDTRVITVAFFASAPGIVSLNFPSASHLGVSIGGQFWDTATFPGGIGNVIVTTLTATHVSGTFVATAQPGQSNSVPRAVQISNGVFDVNF